MHKIKTGVAQLSNDPPVEQKAGVVLDGWLDGVGVDERKWVADSRQSASATSATGLESGPRVQQYRGTAHRAQQRKG